MCVRSEKIIIVRSAWAGLCLGLVLFAGCGKTGIEVYTVPAEPSPPESWGLDSPIGPEKERYFIKDVNGTASITMTILQGDGGGMLENVNRWRQQMGLDALKEKNLGGTLEKMEGLSQKARMIDINGTSQRTQQDTRLVGVIVPGNELTRFYKLMGAPFIVKKAKVEFLKYVPKWR